MVVLNYTAVPRAAYPLREPGRVRCRNCKTAAVDDCRMCRTPARSGANSGFAAWHARLHWPSARGCHQDSQPIATARDCRRAVASAIRRRHPRGRARSRRSFGRARARRMLGAGSSSALAAALGVAPDGARRAASQRRAQAAARALARGRDARPRRAVPIGSTPAIPHLLRHIPDPPIVLWAQGDAGLPRAAGRRGRRIAARDAGRAGDGPPARRANWPARDLVVVSGLARGVDGAAHEGALEAGGRDRRRARLRRRTVIYPPEHRGARGARSSSDGALVSASFRRARRRSPHHFPLRNRIISGLVPGGRRRRGVARRAGRSSPRGRRSSRAGTCWRCPGASLSGRYRGCHALIKDGARLVETVEDVLDETRLALRCHERPPGAIRLSHCKSSELEANDGAGRAVFGSTIWRPGPAARRRTCSPNWAALEVAGRSRPDGRRRFRPA